MNPGPQPDTRDGIPAVEPGEHDLYGRLRKRINCFPVTAENNDASAGPIGTARGVQGHPEAIDPRNPFKGCTRLEALEHSARLNRAIIEGALQHYSDPALPFPVSDAEKTLLGYLVRVLQLNDCALKVSK